MSDSIRISPKYGLNPMIPRCFFCGEPKNEIALLGKLKGDAEAPRCAVIDYEPCDKCREVMNSGITLIGVTNRQPADKRPMIDTKQGLYPTGAFAVITEEGVHRLFQPETAEIVIKHRKCFVENDIIDMITESTRETPSE